MTKIASLLLQQHVEISGGQHVLALGVAPELAADWAARVDTGQVWAASDDFLVVQATGQLAQQKRLDTLHPLLAADLSGLPALPFDVCAVDILDYPNRTYRIVCSRKQPSTSSLESDSISLARTMKV